MKYPVEVLLFSEVFLSTDILDSAINKLNIPIKIITTGSSFEVKSILEKEEFSIVVTDTYIIESIPVEWIQTILHLHKKNSFILITYDTKEEDIFKWLDFGFSDVVRSSLELAISIKKEINKIAQSNAHRDLEKRLSQSNQFLKLILDHVPAGIFWKDKDSHYIGCNQLHARAMHFNKSEDIIGKSDNDFHYSNVKLELFREDDLRVIRDNKLISRITSFERNSNGDVIWTETNKVPIHDEYGNVIGILGLYKDITKSILLEKELRERETHYRTIIENLSEGVIVYDRRLNVINCNSSAEKITGFSLPELMDGAHKKTEAVLIDEKGNKINKNKMPHFLTKNKGEHCSNIIIGFRYKNGRLQWIRFNTVPIFNEDSKLILIVSTLVDITEQKVGSDKLQSIQENLTSIFSSTYICFVYLDTNFNFIQVNEAYARSCGYPSEFFIGKNHFELYPHAENEAIFKRVRDTGEPFTIYAKPFTFPDHPEWGITYWDWNLKPLKDINGKITGLLFSLNDVTENIKNQQKLQQKELLYSNIFNVMSEGIMILDENKNVITCNRSAQKILNTVNDCKAIKTSFPFINENYIEIEEEDYPVNITFRTGKACQSIILGMHVNVRDFKWLSINTQPIFSDIDNLINYVVVSFIDITEKKKIEQELFIKKKMEAIGNITSTIVHDFNNILQPLVIYSNMLHTGLSKLRQTEHVEKLLSHTSKIYQATTNGKEMIQQILKVSQKINQPSKTVDLVKIMKEILNEFEFIKPDNIRIEFRTELKSAKMEANPINIHQIIFNLCNNSIYAMRKKAGATLYLSLNKIRISDRVRDQLFNSENPFAYEIIVKDEGIGIKQEHLDRIFEPYFTTKQNEGGTGLGLTSIYSTIQNLRGKISVISKENVGTAFTIYLPIERFKE